MTRPQPDRRHGAAMLVAGLLVLAGCNGHDAQPKVTHAWVRLPAVTGGPAAAYFTMAGGASAERLIKIESTLARRTEMHESMQGPGGMERMAPLMAVDLPRHATVRFEPGGRHAMLFGLDPAIAPGTAVPLRFGFASGHTAEAEAKTVPAGADTPY